MVISPRSAEDPGPSPAGGMVEVYRGECLEQPRRLRDLLEAYCGDAAIESELRKLESRIPGRAPLLWLGMGASFAAGYAGALLLQVAGRASFALEASEWLYHAGVTVGIEGPIVITTSGESTEAVELCGKLRDGAGETQAGGGRAIVLTNAPESRAARLSGIRLPILAGPELANATKTYTNSTAACILLASRLAGRTWRDEALAAALGFERTLDAVFARRREVEAFLAESATLEVIGRGPAWSGAIMGALCVREMTRRRAVAHSGGGFRHGPSLDVDSTHGAIVLALGRTADLGLRLAAECAGRGGRVVVISTGGASVPIRGEVLHLRAEPVPEPWESLTSVLVSQALTLAMIERTGCDYVRVQTTSE